MTDSRFSRAEQLLATAFLVFSLVGCSSSPSARFYLLSPAPVADNEAGRTEQEDCINLRIARATLPEYLNRPQIVTRTTENDLTLADYDQWAEPLSDTFTRVLAENISRHICTKRISLSPGKALGGSDYRVEVEVYRMDGSLGKEAEIEAWWTVSGGAGTTVLLSKRSKFSEPVKGKTYDALVQAQSRILDTFGREIAEAIRKGSNRGDR
jgi:uncharacterized lipoprotein YmbA